MQSSKPIAPYSGTERVIDELLVLHVLSGDQRAVNRLGKRWQKRLLRVARHITGDAELADIAAQEAWVGICKGWRKLRDPARFSPWAFGILRRKCLDVIGRKANSAERSVPLDSVFNLSVTSDGEDRAALQQAFAALSPEHARVAVLFFAEGLTLIEIAAACGIPLGTAKSRIFYARRQLKAHLSGDEI